MNGNDNRRTNPPYPPDPSTVRRPSSGAIPNHGARGAQYPPVPAYRQPPPRSSRPVAPQRHPCPAPPRRAATPATGRGQIVEKLMRQGVRGELMAQPWFRSLRQEKPDQVVYVSLGVAAVLSVLLATGTASSSISWLLMRLVGISLWLGFAYVCMAIGTKRAHSYLQWAAGIGGAVTALIGIWRDLRAFEVISSLDRLIGVQLAPTGWLVIDIALNAAALALFGYLAVAVHSTRARMIAKR